MIDTNPNDRACAVAATKGTASQHPGSARAGGGHKHKRSISMHEGIAVWCDCCSCEAEPYWAEIAADMGIDLGSDYEDADR